MWLILIAIIGCLIAFWRTFRKFRNNSIYNTKSLAKSTETLIRTYEKISKDVGNIKKETKEIREKNKER